MISTKSLTQITSPRNFYLFGLALIIVGMPLSKFMMSLGQFFLAAGFLLDGKFKTKAQWFLINTPALILCGLYLLFLFGMLYTADYPDGWKDLRIKFPLFVLPILIATAEPLERKQFESLLLLFVAAVFSGTMISMAVLAGFINRPVADIREIFLFHISNVRVALFICLSIYIIAYMFWQHRNYSLVKKGMLALLIAWFIIFLVIMESVTGLAVLGIVTIILLLYAATRKIAWQYRAIAVVLAIAVPATAAYIIVDTAKDFSVQQVDINSLEKNTRNNHPYSHTITDYHTENGNRIWLYVCDQELKEEWNKRSHFLYDSADMRGQSVRFTLIRYLTSKGLRKDADGVDALTDDDVHAVEHGIANVNYRGVVNVKARVHEIIWEYNTYKEGGNPSGHSVIQRLNFWEAGWDTFKSHFWTGVGTGDLQNAYLREYDKLHSPLEEKYRLRVHNQYLAIAAALGIFGLIYFIFSLVYPMVHCKKVFNFLYITFWITAILSMVAEDTLETQAGVTFFAFFNTFYLFAYDKEKS